MVRRSTLTVGREAERRARSFLNKQGLTDVAQNFRCRLGEIDLILRDGSCVVFAEVRYRSGRRLTRSALTVDARKQKKIMLAAALFLSQRPQLANSPVRFDVVGIDTVPGCDDSIDWIRDAFRPSNAF
jgi:putative endonuclease